jgi:hypothetical protein
LGGGPLESLAIYVYVDPLVKEADKATDLGVVGQGVGVAPGDVFVNFVAYYS